MSSDYWDNLTVSGVRGDYAITTSTNFSYYYDYEATWYKLRNGVAFSGPYTAATDKQIHCDYIKKRLQDGVVGIVGYPRVLD